MGKPLDIIYELAKNYFKRHIHALTPEDAEDFAAYYILDAIERKGYTRPLKFVVLDYVAQTHMYGCKASHGYRLKDVKERVDIPSFKELENHLSINPDDLDRFINLSMILEANFDKQTRAAMILYFHWGFTLEEIGQLYGVKKSQPWCWISDGITEIKRDLKNSYSVLNAS